ncbi:membrane protein [Caballeronia arationis]|jgi:uncharacterized membrane protein (DUF485 family)|uniref:Uncharacterized membrane protein, DUF485 family n=1 Tax=Caballeronia arationis TaxID=1777142 RepID=A0A7Z7I3I1_9BURK|nr:DUF485 domain-containing protein [Caballeronia arationis]SAL07728.1 membrane protein [Caballeronia arationis]SOE55500.1 Uncharacterized membrane protein, DUF485 family [Caballeronia arationis]
MAISVLERIEKHPDFKTLVVKKTRLSWSLAAVMLALYFGFVLLVAFSPKTLGASMFGGVMTVGIPVGIAIIVIAFVLTGIYVYRANADLDPLNEKLLKESQS